jgi:hypothetical protein
MPTPAKDEEKKYEEKKEPKSEKYGEIDARWAPYRDGRVYYVLEVFEAPQTKGDPLLEGSPPPANLVTYVVQDPDGKRTEMEPDEFNEGGFEPISRAKMDKFLPV